MTLRSTLITMSNDARGWLKMWGEDFTDAEATSAGGSGVNPLAWQLGHLACVEEDVVGLFSGKPRIVPEDVNAACASGCPAPMSATRFPPLAELWALLDRTHGRLHELVESASDADFDRPPLKEDQFFKSLGQAVFVTALHETYHVGEIAALRKALGKKKLG